MAPWTVLIFGDSWAEYVHPTWPQVLGQRLSAQTFNFASAGSLCSDLHSQAHRALITPQVPKGPGGLLKAETLIVVHSCGNDFIQKMVEVLMGGGLGALFGGGGMPARRSAPEFLQPNPGAREVRVLTEFMETLYRGGARHFLISGVPIFLEMPIWNMLWPVIGGLVNSGQLEALGVSPGDPPRLAVEVQATALHERWDEMVQEFQKKHPDSKCLFFDEVAALERIRERLGAPNFDRSMWDFSMFHPTQFGHQQLGSEAHLCAAEGIGALAALAPHPDARPPAATTTVAQAAPAKAAPAAAPPSAAVTNSSCLTVHVRNVKGDLAVDVECGPSWTVAQLRDAVLAQAPSAVSSGMVCVLALKGKFLQDGSETLQAAGLKHDDQLIAVLRPAAKPTAATGTVAASQ